MWLTTPLAMKSPVPVVMSYIGISNPSGSTDVTRSRPGNFMARPAIVHLRRIAGLTVWKKRRCSALPPNSRSDPASSET